MSETMQPMPHTPADDEAELRAEDAADAGQWTKFTQNTEQAEAIRMDATETAYDRILKEEDAMRQRMDEQQAAALTKIAQAEAQPGINIAEAAQAAQTTLGMDGQAEQLQAGQVAAEQAHQVAHDDQLVSH